MRLKWCVFLAFHSISIVAGSSTRCQCITESAGWRYQCRWLIFWTTRKVISATWARDYMYACRLTTARSSQGERASSGWPTTRILQSHITLPVSSYRFVTSFILVKHGICFQDKWMIRFADRHNNAFMMAQCPPINDASDTWPTGPSGFRADKGNMEWHAVFCYFNGGTQDGEVPVTVAAGIMAGSNGCWAVDAKLTVRLSNWFEGERSSPYQLTSYRGISFLFLPTAANLNANICMSGKQPAPDPPHPTVWPSPTPCHVRRWKFLPPTCVFLVAHWHL